LRCSQFFPPPEEHALKMRVSEVLQRIVTGTDVTKNVNKNNVTHAVLFEAINLVIHLGHTTEMLPQACGLLGRFISIREANIRYIGLETMARIDMTYAPRRNACPARFAVVVAHAAALIFQR
jgi:AP-2 complex subunit alpha